MQPERDRDRDRDRERPDHCEQDDRPGQLARGDVAGDLRDRLRTRTATARQPHHARQGDPQHRPGQPRQHLRPRVARDPGGLVAGRKPDRDHEPGVEQHPRHESADAELDRQAAERRDDKRGEDHQLPRPGADPEPHGREQRADHRDDAHARRAVPKVTALVAQPHEQRAERDADPVLLLADHVEHNQRHCQDA
jgi:hypothetical protein